MFYKFGNKFVKLNGKIVYTEGAPFIEPDWTYSDFNDIADVYASLRTGDKLSILVRHGERGSDTSKTGGLTDNGKQQALSTGKKMIGTFDPTDVKYTSTDVKRTIQTAFLIGTGRGDSTLPDTDDYYTMKEYTNTDIGEVIINGDIYKANSSVSIGWPLMSQYAYEYDNLSTSDKAKFKDTPDNMANMILASIDEQSTKSVNIFASHDYLLEPITVWVSNKQIDLRFWEDNKWITYLAGIARIYRKEGNVVTIPIRCLDKGYQTGY